MTAYPGIRQGDLLETLLHELVHLHVGRRPGGHAWHGRMFKQTLRQAMREAYGTWGTCGRLAPGTAYTRPPSRRSSRPTVGSCDSFRRRKPRPAWPTRDSVDRASLPCVISGEDRRRRSRVIAVSLAAILAFALVLAPLGREAPPPQAEAPDRDRPAHQRRGAGSRRARSRRRPPRRQHGLQAPAVPRRRRRLRRSWTPFLTDHGFNNVRLNTYGAVEPQPGVYDDAYLDRIEETRGMLARHRIFTQIDFHQDLYNERFSGEGFPDWAVPDDGVPAEPLSGFPGSYLTSPGLNRASTTSGPSGPPPTGSASRSLSPRRHVAQRFEGEPYLMGYDLFNEPWPGSQWPTCANVNGCPAFEQESLAPMQQKAIDAIREVDSKSLIWYEPVVISQFGTEYHHPDTGDAHAGMSFHIYCLTATIGDVPIPGVPDTSCETLRGSFRSPTRSSARASTATRSCCPSSARPMTPKRSGAWSSAPTATWSRGSGGTTATARTRRRPPATSRRSSPTPRSCRLAPTSSRTSPR